MAVAEQEFPGVERVLADYIAQMNARGLPWYISPELNSDVMDDDGGVGAMGGFWKSLKKVAKKVGKVAVIAAALAVPIPGVNVALASAIGTTGAVLSNIKTGSTGVTVPQADQIAATVTPEVAAQLKAQGIELPSGVVVEASSASLLDAFGTNNRPLVIAAGVALAAFLLLRKG